MAAKNIKILLVSWTIPPAPGGSSVVVSKLAKALPEGSVAIAGQQVKGRKEQQPFAFPVYYLDVHPFGIAKGSRYTRWLTLFKNKQRLQQIIRQEQITDVIAVFPDEFFSYTALLAARQTNCDFHWWIHNTYLENRLGILKMLARFIQPLLLRQSKNLLTISDGLTAYYNKQYPGFHFQSLQHGFEIPDVTYQPQSLPNLAEKRISFAMIGSLNASCLDAALRMAKVICGNPDYELKVFGKSNARILQQGGVDLSNATIYGYLEDDEFDQALSACHFMLLPHGLSGDRSSIEYQTIFPTRTIPLLYSNRPILAHTPAAVYLTQFLKEADCAEVITEASEEKLALAIKKLIDAPKRQETIVKNALAKAPYYSDKSVAQKLLQILNPGE